MNIEKTVKALEKNGYKVSYFEKAADAINYLAETVAGKTICCGGRHNGRFIFLVSKRA